jgi:peptidoglycan/LPS O-acetylase OafA/YrhL
MLTSQPSSPGRASSASPALNRMTGIRGLAAILIVFVHYFYSFGYLLSPVRHLKLIYQIGAMGVDVFFILSGFILSLNYLERLRDLSWKSYRGFLRARFARIYPVHLFTLLVLTAVALAAAHSGKAMNPAHYTFRQWLENVLLVQTYPGLASKNWNYPSWSISAEWFAYLLFPLLAGWIHRRRRPALFGGIILLAYLLPVWSGLISEVGPSDWSLLKVTAEFLAGCFLYRIYASGVNCPVKPAYAFALVLAASILCYSLSPDIFSWTIPAYVVLLWSLAQYPEGFLGGRVAVYLGQVSYSLYMTHGIVQIILSRVLPTERFTNAPLIVRLGVLCLYLGAITLPALATYHMVEGPMRSWLLGKGIARKSDEGARRLPFWSSLINQDANAPGR